MVYRASGMGDGFRVTYVVHSSILFDLPPSDVSSHELQAAVEERATRLAQALGGDTTVVAGGDMTYVEAGQ